MNRTTLAALTVISLCAGAIALAAPASAQMGPVDPFGDATVARADAAAQGARRFDTLDTDHDGNLTPAEMAAGRPARPSGADRPRRGGGMGMGRMADANGDGKVSKDEYVAMQLRMFDRMDADHDGQLTKAERQAAFEQMRARMMERMSGNMGGGDEGN